MMPVLGGLVVLALVLCGGWLIAQVDLVLGVMAVLVAVLVPLTLMFLLALARVGSNGGRWGHA